MSRTRALVVTPRLPWPLDDGGRIAMWQMLVSVASRFETTLVSMVPAAEANQPLPAELRSLGVRVEIVRHVPPSRLVAAAKGSVGPWPYMLERYRHPGMAGLLRRLAAEERPAFALFNTLHVATYASAIPDVANVLREHNVEADWLERYASSLRHPIVRAYAGQQAKRLRAAEARLCEASDLVLAIQSGEAETLRRMAPRARVEVVPVGVDFSRYAPWAPAEPPIVLLTASFGWPPNAEGARRFLSEGWPLVRAAHPRARLRLVGKEMPEALAAHAREAGAEAVGWVESMAPEFAAASMLVVPLWVGAGMRVKIVEALAAHVPVVSTPQGEAGIDLVPGREVEIAEDCVGLARAVNGLLEDPARARAMAEAGHQRARERFSLESVACRTCELCEQASSARRARS